MTSISNDTSVQTQESWALRNMESIDKWMDIALKVGAAVAVVVFVSSMAAFTPAVIAMAAGNVVPFAVVSSLLGASALLPPITGVIADQMWQNCKANITRESWENKDENTIKRYETLSGRRISFHQLHDKATKNGLSEAFFTWLTDKVKDPEYHMDEKDLAYMIDNDLEELACEMLINSPTCIASEIPFKRKSQKVIGKIREIVISKEFNKKYSASRVQEVQRQVATYLRLYEDTK